MSDFKAALEAFKDIKEIEVSHIFTCNLFKNPKHLILSIAIPISFSNIHLI